MKMGCKRKYFVIGHNKTATTSIHKIFKSNGVASYHQGNWPWQSSKFCAFSDANTGVDMSVATFKEKLAWYPNAMFILNIRPLHDWLISRFRHGERYNSGWAWPPSTEKCMNWIRHQTKHHGEILEFFKDRPQQLVVVDISKPNWIGFLCNELGFKNIKNIHKHRTGKKKVNPKITDVVNSTFEELGYDEGQKYASLFRENSIETKALVEKYRNNLEVES
jgi:hypothetical protein